MKYKVKPTEKQRSTFAHIKRGLKLKDAMIEAGYSKTTSEDPRTNFLDLAGTQELLEKYRGLLAANGVNLDMLSEIQIEGLFDQNGAVRLQYLRETKKDLGFPQDISQNNLVIGIKVVTHE